MAIIEINHQGKPDLKLLALAAEQFAKLGGLESELDTTPLLKLYDTYLGLIWRTWGNTNILPRELVPQEADNSSNNGDNTKDVDGHNGDKDVKTDYVFLRFPSKQP